MSAMSDMHLKITDEIMNYIFDNSPMPITEIAQKLEVPIEWVDVIYGEILNDLTEDA